MELKKNSNHINFVKNDDDIIRMPSSNTSSNSSNQKPPYDPEQRIKRRKQIIWLISLLLIVGLIGFLIFRSCVPKYTAINPTSISYTDERLLLKINPNFANSEYEISTENNFNITIYYYYSGNDHDDYNARVVTTNGKVIQFKLREQTIDNPPIYFIAGNKIDENLSLNTYNWLNTAVANASIEPPATNVGYIILQLVPSLAMIGLLA